MSISFLKVIINGTQKYRVIIPLEDALFYGIRKNATPREERSYPTWPSVPNTYKKNSLGEWVKVN